MNTFHRAWNTIRRPHIRRKVKAYRVVSDRRFRGRDFETLGWFATLQAAEQSVECKAHGYWRRYNLKIIEAATGRIVREIPGLVAT